ncbi:MAG: DUF2508 family protein [Syntrophomonadaceae bacterium]|nr:DUF2508 family protein [Syntrophomonadaceae bacterium]
MVGRILRFIKDLFLAGEERVAAREESLEELLARAHQDWLAAQALFAENDDRDMIDYTVYNLKTAELRYSYLLRKIRGEYQIPWLEENSPGS